MKIFFSQPTWMALFLLLGAGVLVWVKTGGGRGEKGDLIFHGNEVESVTARGTRAGRSETRAESAGSKEGAEIPPVIPLALPTGEVKKPQVAEEVPPREISADDAILAAGGVLDLKAKVLPPEKQAARTKRLESLEAKDWEGKGNLLVNELRAAQGFSVAWQQVEDFLTGKNLFGWPEGQRNWIGDELMTMLREEQPSQAYELLARIQAEASAPDAMRDYSLQHISHLIVDGKAGKKGIELLRQAYLSGNPVLASTALISLHRLSEKVPEMISREEVKGYAEKSQTSEDLRLKQSAAAILKEL